MAAASAELMALARSSNFKAIYTDPNLRAEFYLFLKYIFHLYPEDRFHQLITQVTSQHPTDSEIYQDLQRKLPTIKSRFSILTYAIPALAKQKEEMAKETAELLVADRGPFRGYVEIGSPGRYVGHLRKRFKIEGGVYLVNDKAPALSLEDIAERGQLRRAGEYAPLGDYEPLREEQIASSSIDLVTNFIGFHHVPAEKLDGFVASIRRVLRPGAKLVVRDHDVATADMNAFVSLAHDVFNAGVGLSWEDNHQQVRNFTSSSSLDGYLAKMGFQRSGGIRRQAHDPTMNTLTAYTRQG